MTKTIHIELNFGDLFTLTASSSVIYLKYCVNHDCILFHFWYKSSAQQSVLTNELCFRDMKLFLYVTFSLLITSTVIAKKKKTKKDKDLFDNATLNCLVCKALVEEIEAAINKIDPAKKVEVGSHRINGDGTQNKKLVR